MSPSERLFDSYKPWFQRFSVSPSLQIDGSEKKKKGSSFKVGKKKVKTKLSALGKAKAAQAMELDN
uniref:Uncharacterized protein n=1 Tax=Aegilops tauschii subsp. strangulata TaxID=200361 RepID=A0A453Q4M8_AEGTS